MVLALALIFSGQALALDMDLGNGFTLDVDTALKWSGSIRAEDQDDDLLSNINGDDGNRSFDKGDFVNNRFSVIMDIDLNKDNVGIFLRPKAFYDFAYDGTNAHDSPGTHNNGPLAGGPLANHQDFADNTKSVHRDDIELLDYFAYGSFDLGGRFLDLRAGNQVVSWGESMFIPGGVASAMNPLDGNAAIAPGVEVKEVYLPTGQVSAQLDLFSNLTLAGFYSYEWKETTQPEAGSYFSTADMLNEAGYHMFGPAMLQAPTGERPSMNRVADKDASDDGQFGLSMRYRAEQLNGTEFSLHYINYHEKTPMVVVEQGVGGTVSQNWAALLPGGMANPMFGMFMGIDMSSYHLEYAEDVKLYGLSIGTNIGATNIGCDITYREDYPMMVPDGASYSYDYAEIFQAQVSAIHSFGRGPWNLWDSWTVMGEIGANHNSLDDEELYGKDQFAWGGTAMVMFDYFYILPNLDLKIPVSYKFNPEGTSALAGTFVENADSLSMGLDFTYKTMYQFGVKYSAFIGSSSDNTRKDRDYVGMYVKYTF